MTVLHLPNLQPTEPGTITGPDLAHRAGISYRQLDYWTRTGLLHEIPRPVNAGSGYPRSFPLTELAVASLMADLLEAGLTPRVAHDRARELLEHGHTLLAGIRIELPQDL